MKQVLLKSLPIFFVAALCMCLTSCGGGDDDGSSPSNTPPPTSGTEGQNGSDQGGQQLGNPLTLEAIGSGTITFKNRAAGPVSYRIDNGNVQTIAAGTDGQISVRAGQKVALFGDNATYSPGNEPSNISSTTDFYAYGNIMSLINSNNYNTATTLTDSYTFTSLFEGNTKLRSHPTIPLLLPATNLSEGCYYYMFYGCTSLTTAPVLPAKTLADHCYYCYDYMFYGCSSLNYVKCLAEGDVDNFLFTDSWLEGVAPSGTFVKAPGASWNKVSSSCIPSGWTVVENTEEPNTDPGEEGVEPVYPDINSTPLTLEAISGGTITFQNKAAGNVTYRVGGYAPQTIAPNTNKTIYVTAGQKVSFFGDNKTYANGGTDDDRQSKILCSEDCYVYGNIMSLINSKNYSTTTSLTEPYTFARLFYQNKHIKNHPSKELLLPAKTVSVACYVSMFDGCTSLTTAPELPATALASSCYVSMFDGCTNLTAAPELPATTLASSCYVSMFNGCTSLTIAPELPATTVAEYCYASMFRGCTSLTTAPALPATTMARFCYDSMFRGCTNLISAPALPATTLEVDCYARMFYDCTALTTAPDLPAKTLVVNCYYYMFYNCTNLNYVKCLATNISDDNKRWLAAWLWGVAKTGTFVQAAGVIWPTGISTSYGGRPSKWTVVNE